MKIDIIAFLALMPLACFGGNFAVKGPGEKFYDTESFFSSLLTNPFTISKSKEFYIVESSAPQWIYEARNYVVNALPVYNLENLEKFKSKFTSSDEHGHRVSASVKTGISFAAAQKCIENARSKINDVCLSQSKFFRHCKVKLSMCKIGYKVKEVHPVVEKSEGIHILNEHDDSWVKNIKLFMEMKTNDYMKLAREKAQHDRFVSDFEYVFDNGYGTTMRISTAKDYRENVEDCVGEIHKIIASECMGEEQSVRNWCRVKSSKCSFEYNHSTKKSLN
jgi:hypothetical protein